MAQKTLPQLLDAAKAAKENTAEAERALAAMRARVESGEAVGIAAIADALLTANVAAVREEIACETLRKKATEFRRVALNNFDATARGELDRPAFDAALKRLVVAAREVFREVARHNRRLDELTGELRALAPYEAYYGVAFSEKGFEVNGCAFVPLDVARDVLPAMRKAHRSARRGVPVAF